MMTNYSAVLQDMTNFTTHTAINSMGMPGLLPLVKYCNQDFNVGRSDSLKKASTDFLKLFQEILSYKKPKSVLIL